MRHHLPLIRSERLRKVYPSNGEFLPLLLVQMQLLILSPGKMPDSNELAHFVAATRPGYELSRAQKVVQTHLYDFKVTYLEVPTLAISSSYLRK